MEEGFIPLGRSFFAHYLWEEERVYSRAESWLDLVALGAYSPHPRMIGGVLFKVPRGGIVASERFLSDRWKWSRTKVRAFLDLLKSDGMISTEKDHETTIITLCNYERYNTSKTEKEPEKDRRKTTGEPVKDQREEGKQPEGINELPRAQGAPTLVQAIQAGQNIGCPKEETERFWNHFEAVDWITKNNQPIHNWQAKLASWWSDNDPRNKPKPNGNTHTRTATTKPTPTRHVPGGWGGSTN